MSKKLIIIIISVVLAFFLLSLIGYYFILQGNQNGGDDETSVFKNFFPFGGSTPPVIEVPTEEDPIVEKPTQTNYTQKLRLLSANAVAGAGAVDVKAGTVVRHIEKGTGHIFETELFSPNQVRISNTTIPMVYDAIWGNKNNSLIARYLKEDDKTIDTYGLLVKETSTTTGNIVTAVKYPENLNEISVFGASVFSLEQKDTSSVGVISAFDGSKRTQIWNSPIKELLSQYANSRTVALTTKPHQSVNGFLFFVDTTNGQSKTILGNILGLSTLINDTATQVLYLDQSGQTSLFVFDIKNKTIVSLTPKTFPEKCVWSKKDRNIIYCAVPAESLGTSSLTSWYQGLISYYDNIWEYNIKDQTSSMIGDLYAESSKQIDVIKPMLSENEQYLIFVNKVDDSLWSLDLTK